MNAKDYETQIAALTDKIVHLNRLKRQDYAGTEDVLSNFKRLSKVAKCLDISVHTPWGYALFMCLMKLDRLNQRLTEDGKTECESVEDSFLDLICYAQLAYAIYSEGETPSD